MNAARFERQARASGASEVASSSFFERSPFRVSSTHPPAPFTLQLCDTLLLAAASSNGQRTRTTSPPSTAQPTSATARILAKHFDLESNLRDEAVDFTHRHAAGYVVRRLSQPDLQPLGVHGADDHHKQTH